MGLNSSFLSSFTNTNLSPRISKKNRNHNDASPNVNKEIGMDLKREKTNLKIGILIESANPHELGEKSQIFLEANFLERQVSKMSCYC